MNIVWATNIKLQIENVYPATNVNRFKTRFGKKRDEC